MFIDVTGLECAGAGNYYIDTENSLEDLSTPDRLPETFDLSEFLLPIGNQGDMDSFTSWPLELLTRLM